MPANRFRRQPIYRDGQEPDAAEIARSAAPTIEPYHAALEAELNRVRRQHGFAILYDCHSIRSNIPFLFDGTLPDFNIGTNNSATCDATIETDGAPDIAGRQRATRSVANGRFKGGWTTRHYGRPTEGLHAIQMELAQSTYMLEAPPWTYAATNRRAPARHI